MPVGTDVHNVKKMLDTLRETPADTAAASDAILANIYSFLMKIPPSSDGIIHWFCNKADATTIDAATFLIRLMAYNSPQVVEWKKRLQLCLSSCAFCAQGLEITKVTSQNTYLAAFSQDILKAFFIEFDKWEVKEVLEELHQCSAVGQTSSSDVSSATLYRMVSNWAIFSNPEVLSYLQTHDLVKSTEDWPNHPLPAGVLILLLAAKSELRSWATTYATRSRIIDFSLFTGSYINAMNLVTNVIKTCHSPSVDSKPLPITEEVQQVAEHLPFANFTQLWTGFHTLLRLIPPEWFKSNSGLSLELKRTVFNHLQDKEPYFFEVFKCFTLLMKRLEKDMWSGEGSEYPQNVFEGINDNPFYAELLSSSDSISHLAWIQEYLSTLRNCSFYGSVFEKTVNVLFEDIHHERFQRSASSLMKYLIQFLHQELQRSRFDKNAANAEFLMKILRVNFGTLLSLAYRPTDEDQELKAVSKLARSLIENLLQTDVQSLKNVIISLCQILLQKKRRMVCDELLFLSIQPTTWRTFYSTIRSSEAIASAVCIVSRIAHMDFIKEAVFAKQWDFPAGDNAVKEVNQSIQIIHNGFADTVSTFADYSVSTNAIEILRRPGVGKAVTLLLLSPVEDFQTAGKTLVGLAFDVDGRMDCFRSLLENLVDEALDGIFEFLTNFHSYASKMPEASTLSAALVRCFADLLDVLCASPDGLLHSPYFLRPKEPTGPASRMQKFWNLLTKSLCIIYSRASMWAQYIDTPDMVLWMRDALILARDILNQWRVIENASNAALGAPAKSLKRGETSAVGQQMIEALQDFLPELIRWLRLTDEELLHQSFSLLQSLFDLMKETHVRPSESALEKLTKHVEGARSMNKEAREQKTRLDRGRLLQLSEVLSYFNKDEKDEDDDEVVIVSHTKPSQKTTNAKFGTKVEKAHRSYIQGKSHSTKPTNRPTQTTIPFVAPRISGSKTFTENDQKKLNSTVSVPSFRKSSTVAAGPSRTIPDTRRPLVKTGPKNEALHVNAQSSEESSSSESDSDEGPGVDAFRDRRPKSPVKPKPVERRQIKTLDIPMKINPAEDRLMRNKQAHYNAMRMRPDISDLHRIILSWDYKHVGPTPPGKPLNLLSIPSRFESYDHYFRVFRPLLLMECWAQLQQSKEERQDVYECKVDSRQYVDDWLDIDISISESVERDWYLAETDIVLLRQPIRGKCLMGKIKSYRALPTGIIAVVRCYIQGEMSDPGLQISTLWQISKVLSLSTLHREYGALVSLQYNDMCGFILRPSLPVASDGGRQDLGEIMENYNVNEPQASAILKAMKTQGFSLIQGPPGTGKTSTICSLIARFLSQRPRAPVPIVVGRSAASASSRNATAQPNTPTARILVCAPSNAAIDELGQRIKDGFVGSQRKSKSMPLNIVRIGADQAISASVRDISLDYLVDQKLGNTPKPLNDIGNEIRSIRQELEAVKQNRSNKLTELTKIVEPSPRRTALENEVKVLNSRRQALMIKLDAQKDKQKSDSRTLDTLRRNTRREVITQADVICSTLSGAGHDILENLEFDLIIIDEAAQAIELSSLIPLKYACTRCVMVGDPQQLPPTVLSQEASRFGYNQSLFVRLQQSQKDAINLLSIQYRMHPDISRLPSQIFYDNKLLDGPNMAEKTKQPWHTHAMFGTYKFLNVSWGIEESSGHSIKNPAECDTAVQLYNRLRQDFSSIDFTLRIGVVSMYKAQINALRKIFMDRFGNDVLSKIDFNTVDGFQGQEKDIIILSCVRAGPGLQNVGFLSDIRRMNVALTRAKSSLFVLGHSPTLERSDPTWRKIVEDARTRSALINIDRAYFARAISLGESKQVSSKKKARVTQPLSLPPDLSTPQELKVAIEGGIPYRTASSLPSAKQPLSLGASSSSVSHSESIHGINRALEAESNSSALSKSPTPGPPEINAVDVTSNDPLSNTSNTVPISSSVVQSTPVASSSSLVQPQAHGMKRPLDPEGSDSAPIKHRRPAPPHKKPKQQTMFIPKKRT